MKLNEFLAVLFDCGTDDVSLLTEISSDILKRVIRQAKEEGDLSLEYILTQSFEIACQDLSEAIKDRLPELEEELSAYVAYHDVGQDDLPDELVSVPEKYRYGYQPDVECYSDQAERDLTELSKLDPRKDFEFIFNYQATVLVAVNHAEIYSRLFWEEVDECIQKKIGIHITGFPDHFSL